MRPACVVARATSNDLYLYLVDLDSAWAHALACVRVLCVVMCVRACGVFIYVCVCVCVCVCVRVRVRVRVNARARALRPAQKDTGCTALHVACREGSVSCAFYLLSMRADIAKMDVSL